jgi:hypothetical protein
LYWLSFFSNVSLAKTPTKKKRVCSVIEVVNWRFWLVFLEAPKGSLHFAIIDDPIELEVSEVNNSMKEWWSALHRERIDPVVWPSWPRQRALAWLLFERQLGKNSSQEKAGSIRLRSGWKVQEDFWRRSGVQLDFGVDGPIELEVPRISPSMFVLEIPKV